MFKRHQSTIGILRVPALALALLLGTAMVMPAAAVEPWQAQHRAAAKKGGGEAAAAAKAQRQYGGRVLKVEHQGGSSYKVKLLLDNGRVKTVIVNVG